MFRRYHYLNTNIASACQCWGLFDEQEQIAFMGVLHQPHGKNKKIKRCSRLVVLPDYQGMGLGYLFLTKVANYYGSKGFDFSIVTSAKNLISKLANSNEWIMTKIGVQRCSSKKSAIDYNRPSMRTNCKTASFMLKK